MLEVMMTDYERAKLDSRVGPAGRPIPDHPDALLYTSEAAFLLGLSPRTLEALRLRGGGPPFVAVTPKAVRYRRRDLDDWIAKRIRRSTADPGPVENNNDGYRRAENRP